MGTFAEELYSETLKLGNVKLDSSLLTSVGANVKLDSSLSTSVGADGAHPNDDSKNGSTHEDDFWDDSNEVVETSDLNREWQKRREGFQTIGYRDGIIAGKEASAQEGFNFGFKESVDVGYRWGLVRGVTSALALLPVEIKKKLIETDTKRAQLQMLFESTSSLSTTDALKSFHDDIISKKRTEDDNMTNFSPTSECIVDKYYGELTLFVKESPAINIQSIINPQT